MPGLTIKTPDGRTRSVTLLKRVTSIGRSADNDVVLDDPKVPETAFAVLFDGATYRIGGEHDFVVNGRTASERALQLNDVVQIGDSELVFTSADSPLAQPALVSHEPRGFAAEPLDSDASTLDQPGVAGRELAALKRLTAFSEHLLGSHDIDRLLENLIDECVEVTRADKGFLILMESDQPRVKAARNVSRETIEDAIERVSDSIVAKVVKQKRALIIADALADPEFRASDSVVNLKLSSVMCAPLMHKGDLFGVIYLGNDRLVNRFDQKALDTLTIFAAQASLIVQNALLVNELKLENVSLKSRLEQHTYGDLIGACQGMRDVYKRIDKIAPTDISVLVTGETGTGKELIAKEIHRHSTRAKGPFISINCGAIPENLLESELFGHVRGAFTGAVATKLGRFQAAIGGTLFLDELGEMPLQLQVKLLRALQEKIVYKVGDNRPEPVDIRVVAATNKNLEEEVRKGAFREDLFFRINVVTLRLPPLRERGDDIAVLARFFVNTYAQEFKSRARGLTPAAMVAMKKYLWPGNIRELENRIKKAVVLADKALLSPEDLDLRAENLPPILPLALAKEEFQKRYINEILERNNGNRTKTAKDLAVDPRTIFRHLEKLEAEKSGRTLPFEPELEEM
jgi:transcriptional regulator with GAF, ATPase, and Fis domain